MVRRGDVYYLRYDNSQGHEMAVGRPVIVVSSDRGNAVSPIVNVVFMTTSVRVMNDCVELKTPHRQSWAVCNQISTIDKERLETFKCRLSDEEMAEIDKKIAMVLGLVDDDLRVELSVYKMLYEKAVNKITDMIFSKDISVEKVVVEESVQEEPEVKKKGRPKVNEVSYRATKEEIAKYANETGIANVNSDPWYVISATTGMNRQTAQNVVAYRKKHGDFKSLNDLLDVPKFGYGCIVKYGAMLEV